MKVLLTADSVAAANDHLADVFSVFLSNIDYLHAIVVRAPYRWLTSLTSLVLSSLPPLPSLSLPSLASLSLPPLPSLASLPWLGSTLRAAAHWISIHLVDSPLVRVIRAGTASIVKAPSALLRTLARVRLPPLRFPTVSLPPLRWPALPPLTLSPAAAAAAARRAAAAVPPLASALVRATYRTVFETHLLPNLSCALVVGALVCLYMTLEEEDQKKRATTQPAHHTAPPTAASYFPLGMSGTGAKTRLALSSSSSAAAAAASPADRGRRDDLVLFAASKAKLFGSPAPVFNVQQRRALAEALYAPTNPTPYSPAHPNPRGRHVDHVDDGDTSGTPQSSPGRASTLGSYHDDDYYYEGGGGGGGHVSASRATSMSSLAHSVVPNGHGGTGGRLDHVIKEAAVNPASLVGWQIHVAGKGLGLVLGIKKRLGQATLFRVQWDSGAASLLSLKRSATKGDTPFRPIVRL